MNDEKTETCTAVIACGVLAADLKQIDSDDALNLKLHFLPGGLHATPGRLRSELQSAIDTLSNDSTIDRIVIGYGVCGRGTVGLHARNIPLVIPRIHDCIALFLGSDQHYQEQFAKHPGTYYLSAGWVEENGDGGPRRNMGSDGSPHPLYNTHEKLTKAYGKENADYIRTFMQSWTRNYTRSAFIDTGVGQRKEHYARQAEEMAQRFNWAYERLKGTHELLYEVLTTAATTDRVLWVPPGGVTNYDALHRRLDSTQAEHLPPPPVPIQMPSEDEQPNIQKRHGIGLGIDAGGTYTDAVLYDFETDRVLMKSKALTTHWDYSIGIDNALDGLCAKTLTKVNLTALSTTVATNALVEGHGQAVGLLVMPPCGWQKPDAFRHSPLRVIRGQLEIDGSEIEPVDADQVRKVVQELIAQSGVTAFAIGGYAAHANPAHELQVKSIVQAETGLSVTCSHELSDALHYRIRAETAALNARIIPCLEALLTRVNKALAKANVQAPVMVVRSDGSFMSLEAALERPLETMLSGPAASAAGAGWLAKCPDALIADIGGTTTDTAMLTNGRVRMNPDGACIGGWQTHIRALDLQTAGLGGDSHVAITESAIAIGPERVAPIAWLAATNPATEAALSWIEQHTATHHLNSRDMVLLTVTGKRPADDISETEQRVLDLLQQRPYCIQELTVSLEKPHPAMVPLRRLLHDRIIQRCGFTPTDALHVSGRISLWDHRASLRMATILASRTSQTPEVWVLQILQQFERSLAREMLTKQLKSNSSQIGEESMAKLMIDRILDADTTDGIRLDAQLLHPVIGIGAPASCFVSDACSRIHAEAIVPNHADVANAVGAIIGTISISQSVKITTDESGLFHLAGVPDAPTYKTIEAATASAEAYLRQSLKGKANQAGCQQPTITIKGADKTAPSEDGTAVFITRDIEGHASGIPDV